MEEKNKLYAQLCFIHQRLSQTSQYFIDEFEIAKDAIKTITDMANKLREEIDAAKEEIDAAKEVETTPQEDHE